MQWLYRLERKYGKFRIENLMIYVVLTMAAVYILDRIVGLNISSLLSLNRAMILRGQVWRLVTFVFLPPNSSLITILLALYFYYFIGSALENAWGAFQFNIYYLFGVLGAIVAALISGNSSNIYLNLSLFLAFAQLYPEQRVLLFYLIPVKVKWLAWIDWAFFGLQFVLGVVSGLLYGSWATCVTIIMSMVNFFIFFGPGFIRRMQDNRRYSAVRRNWRDQMRR